MDELTLESHYITKAATLFLNIYDETIEFADLKSYNSIVKHENKEVDVTNDLTQPCTDKTVKSDIKKMPLHQVERELQTGMLSSHSTYRILVSGDIGLKEIERMIKKLEFDKEILASENDNSPVREEESS